MTSPARIALPRSAFRSTTMPASARGRPGAPVGLRRAREDDLLLMLLGDRRRDADPLHGVGGRRFRRESGRGRCLGLRRELAGINPGRRPDDKYDRNDAARLEDGSHLQSPRTVNDTNFRHAYTAGLI